MATAFVLLGSNIEPERHLRAAAAALGRLGPVVKCSRVYQSAAVGDPDGADFLNAAVMLETDLLPEELRGALRSIEEELGRVRDPHNKNAPRTIDLDLCLYCGISGPAETDHAPDPDITRRAFVAVPLAELEASMHLSSIGATLGEIAAQFAPEALRLREDMRLEGD